MLKKCNSEVEQNIIIKKDNLYMVLKMDNKAIEILTKKNIELTAGV